MKPTFLKHFFFPVFFLLVFQGEGRGEVRVTEKIPIKTDIVSNFGAKIQANVDNILAAFPIDETHLFYQKLAGRSDEIHEAILDNIGDIGLRSVDDLTQFFDDIAAAGEELMEAFATNPNLIKAWDEVLGGGLNAMRKNLDFLETMLPYSLGSLSRKFSYIEIYEEAMIRHYTSPAHGPLNSALESGGNLSDDLLEFRNTLNDGLNKLADHNGQVFRGLGSVESNIAKSWNIGETITEAKFVSSTKHADVAEDFMFQGGGDVRLVIQSKTGKVIEDASFNPLEGEVLFGTGKQFKVENSYPFQLDDGTLIAEIILKEL